MIFRTYYNYIRKQQIKDARKRVVVAAKDWLRGYDTYDRWIEAEHILKAAVENLKGLENDTN